MTTKTHALIHTCALISQITSKGVSLGDTQKILHHYLKTITWEDIAPVICGCGEQGECGAAIHASDHDMSPNRYMKQLGCESKEVYEAAERVVAFLNKPVK